MKKYVSSEEINKLNKLQKENLRKLWEPVKYQLVIVPVCKNIENKFYEHKIYVIQDIIVCDKKNRRYCQISSYKGNICTCGEIIFKAFPLEYVKMPHKSGDVLFESNKELDGDGLIPIYYIDKKDCLPLLDISIMIEILCESKCKKDFLLKHNKEEEICVIDNTTQYSDSLCESLWEMLKSML